MDDRLETVHIWNKELAIKNNGRWIPKLISKDLYDKENKIALMCANVECMFTFDVGK